ncbi:hypothetical protein AXF42_Ash019608 [Apostasia shenzhenica]|uniref:Uncharacterized protein n=1 Tax=Apostasia shenzhenica TaxID=1088818 RepID=A0A2I0A3I0_9ASPA|nr:hypothetical protein AXF42_Ash019608 [Apostasia shenzhenica]
MDYGSSRSSTSSTFPATRRRLSTAALSPTFPHLPFLPPPPQPPPAEPRPHSHRWKTTTTTKGTMKRETRRQGRARSRKGAPWRTRRRAGRGVLGGSRGRLQSS